MSPKSKQPATIHDVAKRARVSISTVSRVLNQTVPVSSDAARRVQKAMTDLKFVPRSAARNLATSTTNALGLLLSDIYSAFFGPMLSGIEVIARELGYNLLISTAGGKKSSVEIAQLLGTHNVDGLMIFADSLDVAGLAHYHALGFPIVLIHQSPPESMQIPCVTVENKAASRKLVDHLIEVHQRRRILFLRGPEKQEDSYWRETGYRESLEAHQIPIDEKLIGAGEFDRAAAKNEMKRLIANGLQFDAVFAADDESAIGVLEALKESDRLVPEQVAVVGFDDQPLSAFLTPPLTTVRAPTEEVGREAARQLISLIRTGQAQPLVLLQTEMIIRRSCGCNA
jgi:DNA-binding LacI/PurR family transcriptional regulator